MSAADVNPVDPPPLPRVLRHPPRGRVLVVAPHPDDEIIGCGGTLSLHVSQGDSVRVLVLTSGAAGDPDRFVPPGEIEELRQHEARAAGAVLGIADYVFWGYPDGMQVTEADIHDVAARLRGALQQWCPEIVYHPWEGETHADHHAACRITRHALHDITPVPRTLAYEVWTPCVPNRIVDISSVAARKAEALRRHESQMRYGDLVTKMMGLGAHRSIYLDRTATHGEAFIDSECREEDRRDASP